MDFVSCKLLLGVILGKLFQIMIVPEAQSC